MQPADGLNDVNTEPPGAAGTVVATTCVYEYVQTRGRL
jgi:hypothetical protein